MNAGYPGRLTRAMSWYSSVNSSPEKIGLETVEEVSGSTAIIPLVGITNEILLVDAVVWHCLSTRKCNVYVGNFNREDEQKTITPSRTDCNRGNKIINPEQLLSFANPNFPLRLPI